MATYIKSVFGRSSNNDNVPEISLFEENELLFSSEQGVYLRKLLPKVLPQGWFEISKGNLAVSNKPYFNGFTLEPVEDEKEWEYEHPEKGQTLYNLPNFKQRGENKTFQRTILFERSNKDIAAVLITKQDGAAFFFGLGKKMFFDVPPFLKPLYLFKAGSAILHPSLEVRETEVLMAWRAKTTEEGVNPPTVFRVYQKIIDL